MALPKTHIALLSLTLFAAESCMAEDKNSDIPQAELDESQGQFVVDSKTGNIAGIRAGMTETELQNTGYPFETSVENQEGDDYKIYHVTIAQNTILKCTLDLSNVLARIETTSTNVRDRFGLGIGSTLNELKVSYPQGRFVYGHLDNIFANYVTGTHLVFKFDTTDLDESCFNDDEDCKFEEDITVNAMSVSRYTPK